MALVVTGVLAFALSGAAAAVARWTGNIDTASTRTLTNRPEKVTPTDPNAGEPVNLLLMGSDSREGANVNIGGSADGGERSDTTILLHISGDRRRVEAISIPRDSTVDIPSCVATNGSTTAPQRTKFNAAFAAGALVGGDTASGALCAMQTVEALTGVFLDGFMVIDFQGFQRMIDAVGGVELCIAEEIYAPEANDLHLQPGVQTLGGELALDYARARKGVGDGSDLSRIGRQQQLLASLVRTVLSAETLANPGKTLSFVDAVTSSMTMDDQTAQLDRLTGLAYSLRDLGPGAITFLTVPYAPDPANPSANVVWTDEAALLWENIKNDRPIDHDPTAPSASPSATEESSAAPGASASPSAPDGETIDSTASPSTDDVKEAGKEAFTGADTTAVCG
ncbi:LytR family transcriptional attenuator [Myceligenerans xiligouense]|uniref:LytR family transcriptional attenuator n=1 Tax=Myceligenerans xiligouense TaxID=253184 RepID=A0A3N4ZJJ0_9MICO|nr:LytR family transcriptional attenuator [Myceligenerans xiligouense]